MVINLKKDNKKIAVVIYNHIQCLNILPGVEELIRLGYEVDLYCPKTNDKTGFQDLFDDNIKDLRKKGYKVHTKANNTLYKILLEPYEDPDLVINSKYKIRYRYSQITGKPNVVLKPFLYLRYDCYLSSGKYESRLINNYTNTEIVSDLKYITFKKKNYNKSKKVLVYLPTYGKECSIDLIIDELNNLRKDYYVITKIHHGTCFLKNEIDRIEKIKNSVDEFYD